MERNVILIFFLFILRKEESVLYGIILVDRMQKKVFMGMISLIPQLNGSVAFFLA